ncbi:hypothetical protein PG987_015385 [Apiospora arundinis]
MYMMSGTSANLHGARPSGFQGLCAFLRSCVCALCSSSRPHDDEETSSAPMPEKKYVHVPQHAAAGFLRTSTSRQMRINNEVLV